jgi:hypothetical protein
MKLKNPLKTFQVLRTLRALNELTIIKIKVMSERVKYFGKKDLKEDVWVV